MSILQVATVLIYVTSVLTSSVNGRLEFDQNQPLASTKPFGSSVIDLKKNLLMEKIRSIRANESTTAKEGESENPIITEGGPVINSRKGGTQSSAIAATFNDNILESDERKKVSSIVPRKGVVEEGQKLVGEKGGEYVEKDSFASEKFAKKDDLSPGKAMPNTIKASTQMPTDKLKPIASGIEKADGQTSLNNTQLDQKPDTIGNKSSSTPVILVPSHPNETVSHKRKPTSTTGEGDDDGKGMPSSPTQTEIGMPRKVDYIIPIVITIMATPVLGIAAFVLYTRGRDCWDKRHYRKMDFLIDGMYNE